MSSSSSVRKSGTHNMDMHRLVLHLREQKKQEGEKTQCQEDGEIISISSKDESARTEDVLEEPVQRFARVARTVQFMHSWAKRKVSKVQPQRTDSFLKKFDMAGPLDRNVTYLGDDEETSSTRWVIDPFKRSLQLWLFVCSVTVWYNILTLIARASFTDLQRSYRVFWLVMDYIICDAVYIMDMIVQFRTGYLEQGLLVTNTKKILKNYMHKPAFILDCISLLPLDILYIWFGVDAVSLRFNRLLRLHRIKEFYRRTENKTNYPHILRIFVMLIITLVLIHWNACIYFKLSESIGFGSDAWVYPNLTSPGFSSLTRQYAYSLWWATMTLTTIGETEKPQTNVEYIFVVFNFLIGILVFATIVGNVGSMISDMNAARHQFEVQVDSVKRYMSTHEVGGDIEKRVITWFDFLWENKRSVDETHVLQCLPHSMRTDIAMMVYLDTLKRVKIFEDCEPGLLRELVTKLVTRVFSPGDYVCRKGDIGKEMYIVKSGCLQVVADDGITVLAQLSPGSHFGEISILNLWKGGNRRTAAVRSLGYSSLLCLHKDDLLEALKEYPEARDKLEEQGRAILKRDGLLNDKSSSKEESGINNTQLTQMMHRLDSLDRNVELMKSQIASLCKVLLH